VLAAAAVLAAGLWVLAGGHVGYDAQYALIWGRQLAHGQAPALVGAYAPTPHPLANLLAAIVAPVGRDAASETFGVVLAASLGAVAVAAWRLGRTSFGAAAGVLAAIVVVSRPSLIGSALHASIDVPALALTLFALDALVRERRRWELALVLLAVAGLLRPETWLLSLAVAVWWWREHPRPGRAQLARVVALAVSAPLIWGALDLLLTGDPAFSLHGTQALADELSRPRSAQLAPLVMPGLLGVLVGLPILLAGVIGLVEMSREPTGPFAVFVGVLALSVATFVIIGIEGLPLLARYLFPAGTVLAILGAGAAAGVRAPSGSWSPAGVAAAIALVAAIPATATGIAHAVNGARARQAVDDDLARFVRSADFDAAVRSCGPLSAGTYRVVPAIAYARHVEPTTISPKPRPGLLVLPRSGRAASSIIGPGDPAPPILAVPAGFRLDRAVASRDWATAVSCRSVSP
jgi:hypothetical protein